MYKLILLLVLLIPFFAFSQQKSFSVIDFVKIKNNKQQETVYFYENNWKVYRDIALQKGYIQSYKILTTKTDSIADFDMMLITEYKDSLQLALAEERFREIIKSVRPGGPKLLNNVQPADFRKNLFFKQTQVLFMPD